MATQKNPGAKKSRARKTELPDGALQRMCETLANFKSTNAGYPVSAERLLDLLGLDAKLAPDLSKAGKIRKVIQSTAKTGAKGKVAMRALICLADDVPEVAGSRDVVMHALTAARESSKSRMFPITNLMKHLCSAFHKPLREALERGIKSQTLPDGVGALKVGSSHQYFDLRDVICRPGAIAVAAPVPPPVSRQEFETAANEVAAAIEPPPPPPATPTDGSASDRILQAFDRLDAASGSNNYLTLFDLRNALPDLERPTFDEAVNQLRRDHVVSLDSADGRHERLDEAVTEAGIVEEGRWLVYMKRRSQ